MGDLKKRLASESVIGDFEKTINYALGKFTGADAAVLLAAAPEALRCEAPAGFEKGLWRL